MYGPAAADAGQAARRAIVLAAAEEFGLYAARSSSPGVRPLSVSAPRPARNGTVTAAVLFGAPCCTRRVAVCRCGCTRMAVRSPQTA